MFFLQSLIKSISIKQKYAINECIPTFIIKKIYFFSSQRRMSGNSINFDGKKKKKVTSATKTKKNLI